jgi:hypothetical protein
MGKAISNIREGKEMETDFRILVHLNGDNLHLKLSGNFDSFAVHKLLESIKEYEHHVHKIFIHTNCLGKVDATVKRLLSENLRYFKSRSSRFVFTGEKEKGLRI